MNMLLLSITAAILICCTILPTINPLRFTSGFTNWSHIGMAKIGNNSNTICCRKMWVPKTQTKVKTIRDSNDSCSIICKFIRLDRYQIIEDAPSEPKKKIWSPFDLGCAINGEIEKRKKKNNPTMINPWDKLSSHFIQRTKRDWTVSWWSSEIKTTRKTGSSFK